MYSGLFIIMSNTRRSIRIFKGGIKKKHRRGICSDPLYAPFFLYLITGVFLSELTSQGLLSQGYQTFSDVAPD